MGLLLTQWCAANESKIRGDCWGWTKGREDRKQGWRGDERGKTSETNTLRSPCVSVEHLPSAQGDEQEPGTRKVGCPARVGGQRCPHHGSVSTSRNMAL